MEVRPRGFDRSAMRKYVVGGIGGATARNEEREEDLGFESHCYGIHRNGRELLQTKILGLCDQGTAICGTLRQAGDGAVPRV